MTTTAIPQPTSSAEDTRTPTRMYFDRSVAFGAQHARPATVESADRAWDDDDLLAAAHVGADGRDLHPRLLAALCARFVDMAQNETTHAEELRVARQQLEVAQGVGAALRAELLGERAESLRLAVLHAEASSQLALVTRQRNQAQYERTLALHRCAGTTPAAIRIALEWAAGPDGRFDDSDGDTEVVTIDDMRPAGGGK